MKVEDQIKFYHVKRFYTVKAKNRHINVQWFTDEHGNQMVSVRTTRLVNKQTREIKSISERFSFETFTILFEGMLAISHDPLFLQETKSIRDSLMNEKLVAYSNCKEIEGRKVFYK